MASRRINTVLRNTILANIMQHTFAKRFVDCQEESANLTKSTILSVRNPNVEAAAQLLYKNEYGKKHDPSDRTAYCTLQRAYFVVGKKNEKQNEICARQSLELRMSFGSVFRVYSDESSVAVDLCLREKDYRDGVINIPGEKVIPVTQKVWDKLEKTQNTYENLQKEASQAANAAYVVLNSATTVEKLIEVWPEVEPYIPSLISGTNLPDITKRDLNAYFNLPRTDPLGKRPEAV